VPELMAKYWPVSFRNMK